MSLNEDAKDAVNKGKVSTRRLFFTLWPDDETRLLLRKNFNKAVQHGGGKRVPDLNLHLTLSFLGSVDSSVQDCVEQFADTLVLAPCELILDKIDYWPKPRVLYIGCSKTPQSLARFVCELNDGVKQCGVGVNIRSFVPHITLMRKVNKLPQDIKIDPVLWQVNKFALAESRTLAEGVNYTLLKVW